ncbi:UNVERIFIED_CONTAM: hypothetical protein RMT77_016965 [Armadillidium vulgare]
MMLHTFYNLSETIFKNSVLWQEGFGLVGDILLDFVSFRNDGFIQIRMNYCKYEDDIKANEGTTSIYHDKNN